MLDLLLLLLGLTLLLLFVIAYIWHQPADCFEPEGLLSSRCSLDGQPWWERSVAARRMSIDANTCRVCQAATTTQCSHCKSVKYCGVVCQRNDWGSNHKFECKHLRKQAAAAAAAPTMGSSGGGSASAASAAAAAPQQHAKGGWLDPDEDAPVPQQVLFPYDQFLRLRKGSDAAQQRPPVGLENLSNCCYANAALQCLLMVRPLRAYLDRGLHSCRRANTRREFCLLCELQQLCRALSECGPGAELSLRPLLRHVRRFAKTMAYGRQEDAHEFILSLLNTADGIQLAEAGGKERFDMRSQETTLTRHVFGGYLRSQVVCGGCGAASRRYEACLDLSLELPASVDRLEQAIQHHMTDEVLDGDNSYACDACGKHCRATRSLGFEAAPNVLLLCLKRHGTGRFGKITRRLVYGQALDLAPFMAPAAMDTAPTTYSLTGVIVHLDQMNSTTFGHYICFNRHADPSGGAAHGQWYACDDSRVARTSASHVLSQAAYVLLYTRDSPKPAPDPAYTRPHPLLPPTVAQLAAAKAAEARAAAEAAAAVQAAAAAAAATAQAEAAAEQAQLHCLQQQCAAAQLDAQQQQQEQAEQQELDSAAKLMTRIATAPAALDRMDGELLRSSSSSGSSASSSTQDGASSSRTPCPSSVPPDTELSDSSVSAADTCCGAPGHTRSNSMYSTGSHDTPPAAAAAAAPHSTSSAGAADDKQVRRRHQEARRQQHAAGDAAAGTARLDGAAPAAADSAAATAAGSSSSSAAALPFKFVRLAPDLLQLKARLHGVASAADVRVAVRMGDSAATQHLSLQVPGRQQVQLALGRYLQPQQAVASISGSFSKRRQLLSLQLRLSEDGSSAGAGVEERWYLSGSCSSDASSGTESDGAPWRGRLPQQSSMRAVTSEFDLAAAFGQHANVVARQLMERVQQQQQEGAEAGGAAAAAGSGGNSSSSKGGGSKASKGGSAANKKRR